MSTYEQEVSVNLSSSACATDGFHVHIELYVYSIKMPAVRLAVQLPWRYRLRVGGIPRPTMGGDMQRRLPTPETEMDVIGGCPRPRLK